MDLSDTAIAAILERTKVIALVGWSPKPERPSHRVAALLASKGYRVIPVNPGQAGTQALGTTVMGSLAEVFAAFGAEVDMVDIFRASEAAPEVVAEALEALPGLRTVWMQLGVISQEAQAMAEARGLDVVMDRCPAIELGRLGL
ncbi:CoA-binding protein [Oceanicola sp. S124]|uniref:CoA-binding protein n=1 Tax=Oceanicola sp. S124 TaxID=1042378 RepID=UPI0002559CA9|nr:CoA-binding protein [Oceanicola sp. S124]